MTVIEKCLKSRVYINMHIMKIIGILFNRFGILRLGNWIYSKEVQIKLLLLKRTLPCKRQCSYFITRDDLTGPHVVGSDGHLILSESLKLMCSHTVTDPRQRLPHEGRECTVQLSDLLAAMPRWTGESHGMSTYGKFLHKYNGPKL